MTENATPAEQAKRWHARADEIRAVAELMGNQQARTDLFHVARQWDLMASGAEDRARRKEK